MFYDFGDNTTKFGIEVCFASSDAGDGNTAASSTSSRHSRLLEASGFSTHIEHLPPSVSSPRSQWQWSSYPLPLPGGPKVFAHVGHLLRVPLRGWFQVFRRCRFLLGW